MQLNRMRIVILIAVLISPVLAHAQARDATLRKRLDQHGDLVFAGNSVHTCSGGNSCRTAQSTGGTQNDNDFTMVFIDADSDASTFNSSSSTLTLPQGATVTWAR